jgi:hypothetical protein
MPQPLQLRIQERTELLHRATAELERDPRIMAAWLFGSLGRGEADALSDLDIFVIVDDKHIESICAARREFVVPFGSLLCVVDAPQNALRGGGYLMALYTGTHGPLQADWYWQAQSRARIPQQTLLLFDKVGLPHDDRPTTFDDMNPPEERDPITAISNTVCFFWAMLFIAGKYAYRYPDEERMKLLPYVIQPLQAAAAFAERPLEITEENVIPHSTFAGKFDLLLALASEMEMLTHDLAVRGVAMPSEILTQAAAYFFLIEQAYQQRSEEARI